MQKGAECLKRSRTLAPGFFHPTASKTSRAPVPCFQWAGEEPDSLSIRLKVSNKHQDSAPTAYFCRHENKQQVSTSGNLSSVHSEGYLNTAWRPIYSIRAAISLQINLNTSLYGRLRNELPWKKKKVILLIDERSHSVPTF